MTTPLLVIQSPYKSRLPGTKTMLLGPTGTGKTTSICRLIEEGFNVRAIFTEPGVESVFKYFAEKGVPLPPNFHWHYVSPAAPDWTDLIDSAKKINTMSIKFLSNLDDINKRKYSDFIDILTVLSNFTSDRDGSAHGAADSWGTDTVLVMDSLSGLSIAAMNLQVGSKPVKSQADWGIAVDNLERLLNKLTTDLRCHLVLTAHVERETDEATGGTNLVASTLGRKLGPKLPRNFSDVILCRRDGNKFYWSTSATNTDLKTRNLPLSDTIPPDFNLILTSWKRNGGVIEA